MSSPDFPPIVHFDYDETEANCRCRLCDDYRQAKIVYQAARVERSKHHRVCKCEMCAHHLSSLMQHLAASNKREVYSELSFVLAWGPSPDPRAGECLRWFYGRAFDLDYRKPMWWAISSGHRTLRAWINAFENE